MGVETELSFMILWFWVWGPFDFAKSTPATSPLAARTGSYAALRGTFFGGSLDTVARHAAALFVGGWLWEPRRL